MAYLTGRHFYLQMGVVESSISKGVQVIEETPIQVSVHRPVESELSIGRLALAYGTVGRIVLDLLGELPHAGVCRHPEQLHQVPR